MSKKIKFKYQIGQIIADENRNFTIIDRKYFKKNNDTKEYIQYKIQCNICGFTSEKYYLNNSEHKFIDEYWIIEGNINRGKGCPCCSNKIVVSGINDICTTDSWMTKYFQGGKQESSKYISGSTLRIFPICPDCGIIRNKSISIRDIKKFRSIGCNCGDGNSYPNKFAYAVFRQIKNQLELYQNEYSPNWIGKCRYDNYFIVNNKQYIVEMDGSLGHGKNVYGGKKGECDKQGILRDRLKDDMANNHNITIIRINADISDGDYLKNQMCKALSSIVDLSSINWQGVYEYAEKNLVKEVCEYYTNTHLNTYQMEKDLGLDRTTISKYLKKGNKIGWANYKNHVEKKNDNAIKIANLINQNPLITTSELSKNMKHGLPVIWCWIHRAEELKLCDYNYKDVHENNKRHYGKSVEVYDKENNYINTYSCVSHLSDISMSEFNVNFQTQNIYAVINGNKKSYKGFIFKYPIE